MTKTPSTRFIRPFVALLALLAMAGGAFGGEIAQKARDWQWNTHSLATLHLALTEPPRYRAASPDSVGSTSN